MVNNVEKTIVGIALAAVGIDLQSKNKKVRCFYGLWLWL